MAGTSPAMTEMAHFQRQALHHPHSYDPRN
jgi:hypothetical protein